MGLSKYSNFIHFGLTSQDVNSVAYVTQLWEFKRKIYSTMVNSIMSKLQMMGEDYKNTVMLYFKTESYQIC